MPGNNDPNRNAVLRRARVEAGRRRLDAVLVTSETDIRYIAGFYSSGAMVFLPAKGSAIYLIDPMNSSLAKKLLSSLDIKIFAAPGDKLAALKELVVLNKIKALGVEEQSMTVSFDRTLSSALRGVKRKPSGKLFEEMREIKNPAEIRALRYAAQKTTRIWRSVSRKIKPGMTEREIAAMIDVAVRRAGSDNSFPTIVAAGPNSAYPHAIPTDRKLKRGEHLLVDFGLRSGGYCSDLTRIWGNGRILRKIRLLQKHVRFVHDMIIAGMRPGMRIGSLLGRANAYFDKNGLGKFVMHGLGHGVGLNIHEGPSLSVRDSNKVLKKGMVVTVEPGLYIEGIGGVRVEDMVLITAKGCEVLTQ